MTRTWLSLATLLLSWSASWSPVLSQQPPGAPAASWVELFDGKTTSGWTSFHKAEFPAQGWVAEDGWLVCLGKGGDIVSSSQYEDFELEWDWIVGTNGNSGLKYFVIDARKAALGHEFQMIDDALVANSPKQKTGAFYDVIPPAKSVAKPPGQVNHSRVLVQGDHAEHWLNGEKLLEYRFGSPELKAAVAKSKFRDTPGFGAKVRGRILLQDHGTKAWFRNLRIRPLPGLPPAVGG